MSFSPTFFFTKRGVTTSSTEGRRGRTTAHGRGCHDLLNMSLTFFATRGGPNSSTRGGRGLTTADGRERHELLNMHFFTLESRKGMRERLDTFAMDFFTFKSKRLGKRFGLLTFKFTNSSNTSALLRAGMERGNTWI